MSSGLYRSMCVPSTSSLRCGTSSVMSSTDSAMLSSPVRNSGDTTIRSSMSAARSRYLDTPDWSTPNWSTPNWSTPNHGCRELSDIPV